MSTETMTQPLQALARHHQAARTCHPGEPLLIVFDIDGTLVPRHPAAGAAAGQPPFAAVVAAMRWFAAQPDTWVGLNTGRPESLREETLHTLNALAVDHGLTFHPHLLVMCPAGWRGGGAQAKVAGMYYFRRMGFRVFAAIDDEPANLDAVAASGVVAGALLLHAGVFRADAPGLAAPSANRAARNPFRTPPGMLA